VGQGGGGGGGTGRVGDGREVYVREPGMLVCICLL